jgi:hypothetical protein
MPNYNLVNNGTACGKLIITGGANNAVVNYNPPGGGGNTSVPTAVYNPAGGGTASSPNPGDTLTLGTFTTAVGGTTQNYPGTATFQNAQNGNPKGYYHLASRGPGGSVGDWDAADDGGNK